MREYEVHLGIVIHNPSYGDCSPIVAAMFTDREDTTFVEHFEPVINCNGNKPIPFKGSINRLEEIAGDYKTRNESNQYIRDDFHQLDYAGELFVHNRDYERRGLLPVIIAVSNSVCIDRDLWVPISLHHAKEILNQKPIKPESNIMTLKYILASTTTHHEDTPDVYSPSDVVFMTRKNDTFQHSDMKNRCNVKAVAGGFIRRHRKLDTFQFFGESVSCRVETAPGLQPKLLELVKSGDWYTFEHEMYGSKYAIWAVVPKGHQLDTRVTGINWEKSSHHEMEEVVQGETTAAMCW